MTVQMPFDPNQTPCGHQPPPVAAPPKTRSAVLPIVSAVAGALLLSAAGIGGYILFGPQAQPAAQPAAGQPATAAAQHMQQPPTTTVLRPAPAPRTVYAPAPPPAPVLADPPSTAGDGGSDPYGEATAFSCTSDGSHLYSTVQISNTSTASRDFVGTMTFLDAAGNDLGTGGFSAADLAPGDYIDAYVDTGDPNDPRAGHGDLYGTDGEVGCVISDLHSK